MSDDDFVQRLAVVRQRFAAKLEGRLSAIDDALPKLVGGAEAAGVVFATHRSVHDLCGLGPTLGFPAIGRAARVVERVLLQPSREQRGLTAEEMDRLREGLGGLRTAVRADLQSAGLGVT